MLRPLVAIAIGIVAGILAAAFVTGRGPFREATDASVPASHADPSSAAAPSVRSDASGAAQEPRRTASSPDQIKIAELLRANAGLPSEPALGEQYREIDARYFHGALPPVTVRWEPRLAEVGPLIAEGFRLEGATDAAQLILVNPDVRSDAAALRRVLVHEMVHVAVRIHGDDHGPVFQSYLRQLSAQGAFSGIVATDEEKRALRASLDQQAAALQTESNALASARAEIDAAEAALRADADDLNARTAAANQRQSGWPSESERAAVARRQEALEARAAEHNARVQRHNAAIAEFNRAVERYNLMNVYPDGLDRERYEKRVAR